MTTPAKMPDTMDDFQKRLDKLNDMQKYLPFLDSMIDQINKKNNPSALESQLGKFQHLKSIVIEKNPKKHTYDILMKLEDIIEKLIVKLDYKDGKIGGTGEPTSSASNKNIQVPSQAPSSSAPNYYAKEPQSSEPASKTSSNLSDTNMSSKHEPSSSNTVDMIMKQLKLSVSKTVNSADSSKPKSQPPLTELLGSMAKPIEKKSDSVLEPDLDKDLDGFDLTSENKANKLPTKADLLASSRHKLLKSVQKRILPPEEDQDNIVNKSKNESTSDSRTKSDSDRTGFSDDSHFKSRKSGEADVGKSYSLNSSAQSHRSSDWKKNLEHQPREISPPQPSHKSHDWKKSREHQPSEKSPPHPPHRSSDWKKHVEHTPREKSPSHDNKIKQKLREKFSADITEVYKVGKQVGGSLRSLKDTNKSAVMEEDELFKPDKVTSSKPTSFSPERQKKDPKTSEVIEGFRIDKKMSYLDYLKKNTTDKNYKKPEEKKEKEKEKSDVAVDDSSDEEVFKLVKENADEFPNLSGFEASKVRKMLNVLARKSGNKSPEYDSVSDQDLDDFLNDDSDKNKRRKSHPLASVIMSNVGKDGIAKSSRTIQEKKRDDLVELEMVGDKTHDESHNSDMEISFEDNEDDFAVKLIEDIPPPLVKKKGLLDLPLPKVDDENIEEPRSDIPFLEPRPVPKPSGVPENLNDPRQSRKPPLLPTPSSILGAYNQYAQFPTNQIRTDILRSDARPAFPEGRQIPTIETRRPQLPLNVPPFNPNFQESSYNDPMYQYNLRPMEQMPPHIPQMQQVPQQMPQSVPQPVPQPVPPPMNYNFPEFPVHDNRFQGFDPKPSNDYRNISMNSNNVAVVRPNARPSHTGPRSYGEYRQMKRQELHSQNSPKESNRPDFEKNVEPISKDPRHFDRGPKNDPPIQAKSFSEEKQSKPVHPNIPSKSYEDKRKPQDPRQRRYGDDLKSDSYRSRQSNFSDGKAEEEKRRLSGDRRLSSESEELVSPLERLYQGDDKPKTGRGYGLQNFKIPKKVRDPPPPPPPSQPPPPKDTPKSMEYEDENIVPPRLSGNRSKRGPLHFDDESDSDSSRITNESFSDLNSSTSKEKPAAKEKSLLDRSSKGNDSNEGSSNKPENAKKTDNKTKTKSNPKSTDKRNEKKSVDSSQSETKSKKTDPRKKKENKATSGKAKEVDAADSLNKQFELEQDVPNNEPEPEPAPVPIAETEKIPEPVSKKCESKIPIKQVESQVGAKQSVNNVSESKVDLESQVENNVESSNSNTNETEKKVEKIDEIEDIIRKSFQSGEGELLLAKAKLFQQFTECATNLTPKKLKMMRKIMGTIGSDTSSSLSSSLSSSSESSEEGNEKKKKKKKKKSKEVLKKLSKKKKKKIRKTRIISDSSSSSSEENDEKDKKEEKSDDEKDTKIEKNIKTERKSDPPKDEPSTSVNSSETKEAIKFKVEPEAALGKSTEPAEEAASEPGTSVERKAKGSNAGLTKKGTKKRKKPQSEATKSYRRRLKAKEQRLMKQLNEQEVDAESEDKDKPKPKHKRKPTELDKLHEDIRSMFICEGVVTATGQRTCRLLKEHGGSISNVDMFKECEKVIEEKCKKKVTKARIKNENRDDDSNRSRSQSVETEASRDRSVSRNRNISPEDSNQKVESAIERKLRGSLKLPVVVLQRADISKFGYAYKISGCPGSLKRRHGRNVAKRGGKINVPTPRNIIREEKSENLNNVYLSRNLRKALRLRASALNKRFMPKRLSDIAEKLLKKVNEGKQVMTPRKNAMDKLKGTRKKKLVANKENEKEEKPELAKVDELKKNLSDHAFDKKLPVSAEYSCLLCSVRSKNISTHYKLAHPDSEVLISRLSKEEAEKAIADSNENKYNVSGLDKASTLDAIKRRVKSKLSERGYICRMCNIGVFTSPDLFFAHVSTHTGEFRYKCPTEKCTQVFPCQDSVKAHVLKKHPSVKQNLLTKVVELFPLPTEYDNLYGYLCSKCYFVQTMRRNVELHIAVFHASDFDVDIIKIDMSSKPDKDLSTPTQTKQVEKRAVKRPRSKANKKSIEIQSTEANDSVEESEGRRVTRSRPAEEKQFKPVIETPNATDSESNTNPEQKKKKKRKTEVDILLEMQKKDKESEESEDSAEEILEALDTNSPEMESDNESKDSEVAVFSEHVNEFVKGRLKNLKTGSENQNEEKMDVDENRDDDGSIFQASANSQDSSTDSSTVKECSDQSQTETEPPPKTYKVLKGSAGSVELCHTVRVGPLEARLLVNNEITYECYVKGCVFNSFDCDLFEKHITIAHNKSKWDGMCETCDGIYVGPQTPSGGVKTFKLTLALEHLKNCHEVVKEGKPTEENKITENSKEIKEKLRKIVKIEPGTQEECKDVKKTNIDGDNETENTVDLKVDRKMKTEKIEDTSPFPNKPLLRVRTFFGDRLSTHKGEMSPTSDGPPPLIEKPSTSVNEEEEESEPVLFTIENVMSLNPEAESAETDSDKNVDSLPPTQQQSVIVNNSTSPVVPPLRPIPSSANIAANTSVLLRPNPVPSPKFTVRAANPKNQVPIAPKQNLPFKVLPGSRIRSPVLLTQFGNTSNIRIISSSAVTMQPMVISQNQSMNVTAKIIPIVNSTASGTQPKISSEAQSSSILRDNPLLTQTVLGNKPSFDTLRCATAISSPSTTPIQIKSPSRNSTSVSSASVSMPNPSPSASPDLSNDETNSFRRPHSNAQGGKNVKDAKIYQEMLTKTKLCQLFKCMAVECSFTCSNESVFTQHIGLHEAHQKMQNQKMNIKSKKVYNWQQCAYCCEVIVQSGASLSQHILSEHGHCLYQCAYCFYRAVSQTYVELHQNYVHPDVLTQRPRVILKCKPIPNLPPAKNSAQKQTRRQSVRPYLCVQCNSRFFITQEFMDHLAKEHQSVTAYTCHICKNLCFKADRLIAHYKLHSYGTYQCAYCLHAAETKKEMLFHLCNCHFSQPAYMYVRAFAQGQKGANHLDALEVVSYENDSPNSEHIIEADAEDAEGADGSGQKSASLDLTAIVTELGIDVAEDSDSNPSVTPVMRELMNLDNRKSASVEALLPNAQFSSEDDNSIVKDNSLSVPIGQLPLEALGVKETTKIVPATAPQPKETTERDKTLKINEIIVNLSKDKSITIVEKPRDEPPVVKSGVHRMPPTVSPTKFSVKNVYSAKGAVKKPDSGQEARKTQPILYQRLSTGDKSDSEDRNPQVVASSASVQVPSDLVRNVMSGGFIIRDSLSGATAAIVSPSNIIRVTSPKANISETSQDQPLAITNVVSLAENDGIPQISEVRSLSQEEVDESNNKIVINIQSKGLDVCTLQPPIIRVEDFQVDQNANAESEKNSDENCGEASQGSQRPESPEVIILDDEPDDDSQNVNIPVVNSGGEKQSGKRTRSSGISLLKKPKIENETPTDDKIRQEMEQLRDQIQNETDCWLFDDDEACQKSDGRKKDKESEILSPIHEAISSLNKKLESEKDETSDKDKESNKVGSAGIERECNEDSEKSLDKEENVSFESCRDKDESKKNKDKDKGTEEKNVKNPDIELNGKDLYLCGVGTCTFAAETDRELKDHLHVCDHSRESSLIICPHCSKGLKQPAPYVEHLKLHGEKKFKCGLCNFASGLEISVVRHLKLKHKVNQCKSIPREPTSKGYFTVFPKNHKTEAPKDLEMTGYSPGDEDKLPLQAVYLQNVKCAMCPYYTKVRSNMVRHLKIHVKSVETEGVVIVPSTAPTNPVPCLDTKEKMFDKMTNLAASSQLAQAKEKSPIETLKPEEEAKLPQFINEKMRYKCCSPDCTYLTTDENMLRNHIKTLHDEITFYTCPHCQDMVPLDFRIVALEKVGNHLKYHDTKLYRCAHCSYFHHQKHIVEKHVIEKHPEKKYYVHTVREPKIESASEEEFATPVDMAGKAWKCGLCDDFESSVRNAVQDHLLKVHSSKSKYKCKLCDVKSSQPSSFANHFASKHPGEKAAYIKTILKITKAITPTVNPEVAPIAQPQESTSKHFDTTPIWQRDAPRVRHIRGILIEEEEVKTKKSKKQTSEDEGKDSSPSSPVTMSDCYYCPLCQEGPKIKFQTKSADAFKSHLYMELNYNPFACMLCGKMFVDKKEFEKHHVKAHPGKPESFSQTKEDPTITFYVEKVISKQRDDMQKKRRTSSEEKTTPAKKKKAQSPEKSPRSILKKNLAKRSFSSGSDSDAAKEYEKELICRHCQIKVSDMSSLKMHIKVSHLKLGRYLCTFCESTFQTETLAQKHCRNEHPSDQAKIIPNPDKTELNEEFWKNQYGFENSKIIKNFVPKNVIRCRFCNFRDIPQLVRSHEKQHLEAIQFKCGHCSHKSKEREEMIQHISNSHPNSKCLFSEVSIIPNSVPSKSSKKTEKNELVNIVYSCKLCPLESNLENVVTTHLEDVHKTSDGTEIRRNDNDQVFYCCNKCVFRASDIESLTKHGGQLHGQSAVGYKRIKLIEYDLIDLDDIEECVACHKTDCICRCTYTSDTAPNGYHNCPKCDFICQTYEEAVDHFSEHYPKFGCRVCPAKFITETDFEEHHKITKHPANYKILEPAKNALEEYKKLILTKRNGKWVTLGKKRTTEFQDAELTEPKKFKGTSNV